MGYQSKHMSTEIKCPNCNHTFPIEEVMAEEYKQDLREQMASFKKKQLEEYEKRVEKLNKTMEDKNKKQKGKKMRGLQRRSELNKLQE